MIRHKIIRKNGEIVESSFAARIEVGSGPGIFAQIRNFSRAYANWRAAGYPRRGKEEIKKCLAICGNCEFWNPNGNLFLGKCRHPKCGCSRFKPQWATERCPIGKW
jgi:hypothetical protein